MKPKQEDIQKYFQTDIEYLFKIANANRFQVMRVRVKDFSQRPSHWNPAGFMDHFTGQEIFVSSISHTYKEKKYHVAPGNWVMSEEDFTVIDADPYDLIENPVEADSDNDEALKQAISDGVNQLKGDDDGS